MTAVTKAILLGAVPGVLIYGLGRVLFPRFIISEIILETNKVFNEVVTQNSSAQSDLNPMERISALSCKDLKEKMIEKLERRRLNMVESTGGEKSQNFEDLSGLYEEWNLRHPGEQRNDQTLKGRRAFARSQTSPHPGSCTRENQKDAVSSSPISIYDFQVVAQEKAVVRAQYLGLALTVSTIVCAILAMPNSIRQGGDQLILAYRSTCVLEGVYKVGLRRFCRHPLKLSCRSFPLLQPSLARAFKDFMFRAAVSYL